jgi:hypothetical protein
MISGAGEAGTEVMEWWSKIENENDDENEND